MHSTRSQTETEARTSVLDTAVLSVFHINLETLLYILLAVIAALACFSNLGARTQSHDESLHALYSWKLYAGDGYEHNPMMHGPFLFHINALFYFLFGVNDFTARISTAAFGVVLVLLPAFLRKELGRAGALVVSVLTLISPTTLYYARYIRNDIYMMVWAMLMTIALFRYFRSRESKWIYLGAIAVTLALCTKETAYITGFIGLTFLVVLYVQQMLSQRGSRTVLTLAAIFTLLFLILFVVLNGYAKTLPETDAGSSEGIGTLTQGQVKKVVEVIFLLVGILVTMLISGLLIRRNARLRPALSLIAAYVAGMASMVVLCAVAGAAAWLLVVQLPEGLLSPTLFVALQVLAVAMAVGAGGYAWWRLLQYARQSGWLPAEFHDRVLYICLTLIVVIFVLLYTTFFTNPKGLGTGTFGAISYWLAQQEVKRAGQPWFYYLVIAPLYEFVPIGFGLVALIYYLVTGKTDRPDQADHPDEQEGLSPSPFVPYLIYWTLSAWLIYSWAGEKMPWMLVHMVQPMIVLSGRFADDLIQGLDWRAVWRRGGGLLALMVPVILLTLGMIVGLPLFGQAFKGMSLGDLNDTSKWLSALLIGGTVLFAAVRVGRRLGSSATWRVALVSMLLLGSLFTIRFAWMASFINYDTAKEFLVYAHGTSDVRDTVNEIKEISRRLYGDEHAIKFAYSSDATWPFEWYFETEFPNRVFFGTEPSRENTDVPLLVVGSKEIGQAEPYLGKRYYRFDRKLVWWPHQDYYMGLSIAIPGRNLGKVVAVDRGDVNQITVENWAGSYLVRVDDTTKYRAQYTENASLDFVRNGDRIAGRVVRTKDGSLQARSIYVIPPGKHYLFLDLQDPEFRRDFWDILFYRKYDQSLADWQPSHAFAFYVRKDVAAQLWDFGAAPTVVEIEDDDPYSKAERPLNVVSVWGGQGTEPGRFQNPRNVAIGPDGSIYVADNGNNRIQKLAADGSFLTAWGHACRLYENLEGCEQADGAGGFYDPWGLAVDQEGFVYVADTWNHRIQKFTADGEFVTAWGSYGTSEAAIGAEYLFWGPRDVAVDSEGLVYVTDTGNKRIQVFTADGIYVDQWGGKGMLDGQFDEPVGLAIASDDRVFVVDTWNQRIQAFGGPHAFLRQWEVYSWPGQSLENKPYLAVDAGNRLYVTDPEGYRILVFDQDGAYLASLRQYGNDEQSFMLPTGIAVDGQGFIYVADPATHRVLKLEPIE